MTTLGLALHESQQLIYLRYQLPVASQDFASGIQPDFRAVDQAMRFREAIDHVR